MHNILFAEPTPSRIQIGTSTPIINKVPLVFYRHRGDRILFGPKQHKFCAELVKSYNCDRSWANIVTTERSNIFDIYYQL